MKGTLVLISGGDPARGIGGHSRYVRTQAAVSKRAGYEPHIFCAATASEVIETPYSVTHRITSPFRSYRHVMMPFHARRLAAAVVRFLEMRRAPHLIHTFGVWGYAGALAAAKLRARGVVVIHVVTSFDLLVNEARAKLHGLAAEHGVKERARHWLEFCWVRAVVDRLERHGYRQADRIVVNYESVRRLVVEYAPQTAISKLPYTSETAFRETHPRKASVTPAEIAPLRPRDAPLIVCVSRHSPRKGVDVLLRALALLREADVPFRACLVGRGPLLETHRQMLQAFNLTDSVTVPGFVADSFECLAQGDIFVLPSLEEGSGSLSLMEALQAGVPVIATNVDGIPEDVSDGESALLVRPGSAEELAAALRRLLGDAPLRDRLRTKGQEIFRERFLPEKVSAALRALYEEMGFA